MRSVLVLQWTGSSVTDFDDLVEMEDALVDSIGQDAIVDGHDIGMDEMNILIETDEPAQIFEVARKVLSDFPRGSEVRAAYRAVDGEDLQRALARWIDGIRDRLNSTLHLAEPDVPSKHEHFHG